ncbi:unnamed protein product [Didymodactylos carnosus]|uniref:Oligosaccharyltransferase complex subunit n=2 Tax=Didymodactylos carnosus TaxID=1234261 RepID=A0A815U4D5_9BILA|nr:unnamed protein product [Didymodactylos carnosus]CAF4372036.1 unnamed protein product [Didymodactylos carnosus]
MMVFASLLLSYFLVTAGIIYDIIVEPPSVGSTTDEYGHHKPVAFMAWRINGQYIMEGLAASFMFTLGGLGFIILDLTNKPSMPKLNLEGTSDGKCLVDKRNGESVDGLSTEIRF